DPRKRSQRFEHIAGRRARGGERDSSDAPRLVEAIEPLEHASLEQDERAPDAALAALREDPQRILELIRPADEQPLPDLLLGIALPGIEVSVAARRLVEIDPEPGGEVGALARRKLVEHTAQPVLDPRLPARVDRGAVFTAREPVVDLLGAVP